MTEDVLKITDASFGHDVEKSQEPVLVDFWAEWCGPCRLMGPILDQIAPLYKGRLKVGKVNVDDNPEVPSRFGVMNIPTMFLFKDGREAARFVGALSKADLQKKIDQTLAS